MPQTVGQYRLIRKIGEGGMAEVWVGQRASMGRATKSVAIKLMATDKTDDARHRRMFLEEARLSMLMSHSNVVQVFDAGQHEGRPYLVMEWVDGLDLARLCELRRGTSRPWPARLSGYIVGEILRGLAYAHHLSHQGQMHCVVHRDVSPHNVLVSTSGEVKVTDFGVARLATEDTSGIHIKGKLRYMAPEHLAGRSRDPAVDLFSVGAVLHELLAGARFRDELREDALYAQILGGGIPPLPHADVPPELASLREGLLQPEPRLRIPTAVRALEYLEAWAGYRNAAGELAALCRGAMGVVAPRSGIEAPSVGLQSEASEASEATDVATVVTRTSGPVAAVARRSPGSKPSNGRGPSRRTMLVGAGILGGCFVGGGLWVWGRGREPAAKRSSSGAEDQRGTAPLARDAVGPGGEGAAEPDADLQTSMSPRATGDGSTAESPAASSTTAPRAGGTGTGSTADPSDATASTDPTSTGPARDPVRSKPVGRAKVTFGLRHPLRTAYVRLGDGEGFAVAPQAKRNVPAGRVQVFWKRGATDMWVQGRTFQLRAGQRYSIRITATGPVLE